MIFIDLELSNPFAKEDFKNLWSESSVVSQNKVLEIEATKYSRELAHFTFQLSFCQDHAGLVFGFGLLGYSIRFNLYDTRHWDYEKNAWCVYEN